MDTVDRDSVPSEVRALFEDYAFQIIAAGWQRYSSDAILHRIRWHMRVDQGNREFKCNDHWTAALSRWFMDKHPQHVGFFEVRCRKSLGETPYSEAHHELV